MKGATFTAVENLARNTIAALTTLVFGTIWRDRRECG
jgi:hypothetical protein